MTKELDSIMVEEGSTLKGFGTRHHEFISSAPEGGFYRWSCKNCPASYPYPGEFKGDPVCPGPKPCTTCGGIKIVSSRWPSGYPHATPCPQCKPDVPCGCGLANCPSIEAIEHWKRTREVSP